MYIYDAMTYGSHENTNVIVLSSESHLRIRIASFAPTPTSASCKPHLTKADLNV